MVFDIKKTFYFIILLNFNKLEDGEVSNHTIFLKNTKAHPQIDK